MNCKVFERIEFKYESKIKSVVLNSDDSSIKLKPFIIQPTEFIYDEEGVECKKVSDEKFFAVRFTPKREGIYNLYVVFENGDSKTEEILCEGFYDDGYVMVSKKDTRYFCFSNEKPYFPIGINMAFPKKYPVTNKSEFGVSGEYCYIGMREYESWLKKCSKNGVNVARVWLGHDYFTPDTEEAYVYDYSQFAKIDKLFELAKKYGIKLKITLENFRKFKNNKNNTMPLFSKSLELDGKECLTTKEWLTEKIWKDAWINKIEEFAARYAGDTAIFAVELWNEMNAVGDGAPHLYNEMVEWNKEMLPKVKELFEDNLVTNSLGSLDREFCKTEYKDFPWDKCDFMQIHRYLDQGATLEKSRHQPIEAITDALDIMQRDDTPIIIAETGAVNNCHCAEFKYYSSDDLGLIFVDCVYTPVFWNSASCGHIWHWDSRYVESKNLYKYYKPLADMIGNIDFTSQNFKHIDLSDDKVDLLLLEGERETFGFIRNKSASWKNVLRDLNEPIPCQKQIEISAKNIEAFPIWKEDTTRITFNENKLLFDDVMYGTIFKITN